MKVGCEIPKDCIKRSVSFYNLIGYQLIVVTTLILNLTMYRLMVKYGLGRVGFFLCGFILDVCVVLTARFVGKLTKIMTPLNHLQVIGDGILDVLKQAGLIESQGQVRVEEGNGIYFYVYLFGANTREKELFATCVEDFLGKIDNQRYLLYSKKRWKGMQAYYRVPEVFSGRKEEAEQFRQFIQKRIGSYLLIYTRSNEGRKILLKARAKAFANQQENVQRIIERRKKKVKEALE